MSKKQKEKFNIGIKMNKLLLATAVAAITASALAGIEIGGTYEGTASADTSAKDLAYAQELDLVITGTGTHGTVTAKLDENADIGDLYLDTSIANFDVRLGKVNSITGVEVSTTVAGITVSVHKAVGTDGAITVDTSTVVGAITLSGEDVLESDRLLSAGINVAGIDVGGSYQNTTTGLNTIFDAGLEVQGISIDVAHASIGDASVTKTGDSKHALLGTMTSATNGTTVKGAKASLGDLSAKVVSLNSNNTYTLALERGIMTYSYEKVSGGASTVKAGVTFTF